VFLDETAANTRMVRRYGWAPRGERCRIAAPAGLLLTPRPERDFFFRTNNLRLILADPAVIVIVAAAPVPAAAAPRPIC
jgi:hypothetical protein